MANSVSPYSETAPQSPSHSPVPGKIVDASDFVVPGLSPERPSSSPGHASGVKWKHPSKNAKRGKSPYSIQALPSLSPKTGPGGAVETVHTMKHVHKDGEKKPLTVKVGKPSAWDLGHPNWDWRQIVRADEVQKMRDEQMKEDLGARYVSNYLALVPTESVYTLMNEREELSEQVKRISHLIDSVPSLESDLEQADRLASKHEADLDEKQRLLSQTEAKLYGVEAELGKAIVRQQDGEAANVELTGNIQDLRDFKETSMETEKLIKGQVQDLAQRSAQLEQELKEALRLQEETDKLLQNAKDDHLALEKRMLSQHTQHLEVLQQQRDEAAATKQRRDDLENDLRRRYHTEIAILRKIMDHQHLESEEALQKVTAERNLHQETTVTTAALYSKEVGDLRNEVHEERRLVTQADTRFADAKDEQKKDHDTIDTLRKELLDAQEKHAAELREQTQYVDEVEAQAKSYIVNAEALVFSSREEVRKLEEARETERKKCSCVCQ